jgi:hypothetical protein
MISITGIYSFNRLSGKQSKNMKKLSYLIPILLTFTITVTNQELFPQNALVHFWYFDNNIANDTPLTAIDATYSLTGNDVTLEYQSALEGYPFTSDDPNWRKASMERRNIPTQINYKAIANQGLPYDAANMRGIQIRQPFAFGDGENALIFHLPTPGFKDVVFSFAAINEGAAEAIVVDYSHTGATPQWTAAGMNVIEYPLHATYSLFTIDFSANGSNIPEANNNEHFKIRLRFKGSNLEADEGNRVNFNNFSLDATPMDGNNLPPVIVQAISLQKAIAKSYSKTIDLSTIFSDPDGDPLTFKSSSNRPEIVTPEISGNTLSLNALKPGDAIISVSANDENHPDIELSFRVLSYPEPFDLSSGNFSFTQWSSDQKEYSYPENMIFLQTEASDPALNHELLFPYFIPHDDYHENDLSTVGFPYNNTTRTRIAGLDDHGIAFLNTGRDRDLGGALVALNTADLQNLSLSFLAGTLFRNERLYAFRVQYRVGTEGSFTDIRTGGSPVQYVVGNDGDVTQFDNIELPEAILGQDYVQILWRYFLFSGDTGPRSMLRLDDIYITRSTGTSHEGLTDLRIYSSDRQIHLENIPQKTAQLSIYNLMGQKVQNQTIQGDETISIDLSVSPGIYIVVLSTFDKTISRKIILP